MSLDGLPAAPEARILLAGDEPVRARPGEEAVPAAAGASSIRELLAARAG